MNELFKQKNVRIESVKDEGLVKEYKFHIPSKSILDKVEASLLEEQKEFKMAGFRDGKVPLQMIRKKIGAEILAKVIEREVDEILKELFKEKGYSPALQPNVEIQSFDEKSDLSFTAHIELMPSVPQVDWSHIELETVKVKVTEEDLTKAHEDIVRNFKNFIDAPAGYAAKKGDAVIIDFVGTINDKEFDGGKGEGIRLELGSNQFVPGFEDQLIGAKAGVNLKVRVVFPKNYNNKDLASKMAIFDVKVVKVLKPESVDTVNEDFAKKLGVESLTQLNELIKQKIEADFNGIARLRLKKQLFDQIDSEHRFEIPPGMVDIDFGAMWNEIKNQKESNAEVFKNKTEDQVKAEYTEIAKRRVRLGILLAETAKANNIEVSDADLQQAVYSEALLRPGQEKVVLDFYAKRENLERLRGPILEEKAVDYILTKVKRKEIEVTSKEFFENYAQDLNPGSQAA